MGTVTLPRDQVDSYTGDSVETGTVFAERRQFLECTRAEQSTTSMCIHTLRHKYRLNFSRLKISASQEKEKKKKSQRSNLKKKEINKNGEKPVHSSNLKRTSMGHFFSLDCAGCTGLLWSLPYDTP